MTIDERINILEKELADLRELKKVLAKVGDADMRLRMERAAMAACSAKPVIETVCDQAAAWLLANGNTPKTIAEIAEAINVKAKQLQPMYRNDNSRFVKVRQDGRVLFAVANTPDPARSRLGTGGGFRLDAATYTSTA